MNHNVTLSMDTGDVEEIMVRSDYAASLIQYIPGRVIEVEYHEGEKAQFVIFFLYKGREVTKELATQEEYQEFLENFGDFLMDLEEDEIDKIYQ